GLKDALGAGIRNWYVDGHMRDVPFVLIDPDCARFPLLAITAMDLQVELLKDGRRVEEAELVASDADSCALTNSRRWQPATPRFYGSTNFAPKLTTALRNPREANRFSVRVTSQSNCLKFMWHADRRWAGQITIPWTELVRHESERVGPQGRGPEISTPYFK